MEDKILHTQCREIEKCINGLSLTLVEAGGSSGIFKIMNDVHKVIQSFRLLGNYYVSELLKKCRELDTRNQEVKELSWKLERVEGKGHAGHTTTQKTGFTFDIDAQRPKKREREDDHCKYKKELSDRDDNLSSVPDSCNKTSQHLKTKSLKNLACLKEELDKSSKETGKLQEEVKRLATSNECLTGLLGKCQNQLEELQQHISNLKGCLFMIAASSPMELLQMDCRHFESKGFDEDMISYLKIILEKNIKPVQIPVETRTLSLPVAVTTQPADDNPTPIQPFKMATKNDVL